MKPNSSLKDIRFREWINYNTDISKALKLLIELEDIFYDIDKISLDNDQCYPEFEDFMLHVDNIRYKFVKKVESDKSLFDIK